MRLTRLSFWGSLATLVYIPMIIVPKVNQTGVASAAKDEARHWLDDANKEFDAVNSRYQTALLKLTTAQQQITDGNCFVSRYNDFANSLSAYCQPKLTNNSLYDLTAAYGIDIVTKPPAVTTTISSRQDGYNGGQKDCDAATSYNCYTVTTVRNFIYGTSITGAGTNLLINCGLYKNGIVVRSDAYVKSSTGVKNIDKYNEVITDTYASTGNVDVVIDAVIVNADKYEIDPYTVNYQGVAAFLIAQVLHQCKILAEAVKSPQHYLNIVAINKAMLSELNAEVDRLLGPYRNATAYKNQQQDIFNIKSSEHTFIILITTLLVLIPVCTTMLLAYYEKMAKERSYTGYSTCGADLNSLCSWAYDVYKARRRGAGHVKLTVQPISSNSDHTVETEMTSLRMYRGGASRKVALC